MADGQAFDMEEYIRKRMLEITSLKDREALKQVAGDILTALYDYNKDAYHQLEDRILKECSPDQNHYAVHICLTDRQHYDETDTFLYPMRMEDTKKTDISCRDIQEALAAGRQPKLYTVFIQCSASQIYQLLHHDRQQGRFFNGTVRTDRREYKAVFSLQQNTEYLQMVEELYAVFGANFQPWFTVCTAYLTKMLDVCLCSMETVKDDEEIVRITVDFEEYSTQVAYDMIPLWNLRPLTEKTSTYPNPCVDKINYEHQFYSQRLDKDCAYLVRDTGVEITNIRRLNGDLYITCPLERPCEWNLYEVHQSDGKGKYPYPVLSNQFKESFSGSITELFRKSIKTRAEMARLIESFDYGDYVTFRGFEISSSIPAQCAACNYNMDQFIADEIRTGGTRQVLVVQFTAKDHGNYLNEDIMSFLTTQVQRIFPDYYCVGVITG